MALSVSLRPIKERGGTWSQSPFCEAEDDLNLALSMPICAAVRIPFIAVSATGASRALSLCVAATFQLRVNQVG